MKFSNMQLLKVVELADALVICRPQDNVPKSEPLIIADMPTVAEYLIRYHEARCKGLPLKEAHKEALKGAKVITDPALMGLEVRKIN